MAFEREKLVEAAWVTLGVAVFIAVLVGTAAMNVQLATGSGALVAIGSLVVFLLVMAGIGLYLASQD